MHLFSLSFVLAVFLQSGLAGEWKGDVQLTSPDGTIRVRAYEFVFIVEGAKLTGKIHYNDRDFAIGEGEIQGSKIRFFQMQLDTTGALRRSRFFEGELKGDELTLTVSQPGAPAVGFNGQPRQPPPTETLTARRKK